MRLIIAGSREGPTLADLQSAFDQTGWTPTVIISGCARGADRLGELVAEVFDIPCERYPADWKRYGKGAGYIRNKEMAKNADALIALWDGESKGTQHMIKIAKEYNLKVWVQIIKKEEL